MNWGFLIRHSSFVIRYFIVFISLFFVACSNKEVSHIHEEYTCSMHPQVVQDKPGTCPICGMDLVKKSNGGNEMVITDELKELTRPTNTSIIAAIKTIHPELKTMQVQVTAPGIVSYDTRRTYAVPVRFGGRIEKLYLKYNYQPVKKGQVIMEVYSPELVTAQRELLYVVSEHKEQKEILDAAKQKLLLLGLTSGQIDDVIAAGKETFAFPVLSPYSGYIIESAISTPDVSASSVSQLSTMGGKGMNSGSQTASMNASSAPSAGLQFSVREGMYITAGQSLFKVVDDSRLWVELYFSPSDGKHVRKGDPIELIVKGTDEKISSQVDFIQPFFNEGGQFLQVRSYLKGNNNLRVGQLIDARVSKSQEEALWVPKLAVFDLGVQQIVFIKNKEAFSPFKVKTGIESNGWVEITEGIDESAEIAVNAQYLVDSESFIKVMNP